MNVPRLPFAETTIFTIMSALANEHKAINLSQGFPDFPIDGLLGNMVADAIAEGYNQYAPMAGLVALREAIATKIRYFQGTIIDPEAEITITPGATYAIYTALTTILEQGDEVIVLEPAYDSYIPNIILNKAIPVTVPIDPVSFSIDWERVASAVSTRTKAIIINNPHNPLGSVLGYEDLSRLAALADTHNLYVLSDEVYEHLVFDERQHISVLKLPELRRRSFVVHSFGKVFNATGWKAGYCIAPPELMRQFRQVHQYLAFSVNTPVQKGLADYLADPQHIHDTNKLIEARRNSFLDMMKETSFAYGTPAGGSYFQVMNYSAISDMPDKEFAQWLTREHGVAVIPVSAFYRDGTDNSLVRFCFAKQEQTLREAAKRLQHL